MKTIPMHAGGGLLLGLALLVTLAAAAPPHVLLEIKSSGGYREAHAPQPFVFVRVLDDGQVTCHCDDYGRVEGRIDQEKVRGLGKAIEASGFFDLRGGASKVKNWWRGRFTDVPTVEYLANVGEKRRLYRRSDLREPEPEALRKLRQLVEPLREELCRTLETVPKEDF